MDKENDIKPWKGSKASPSDKLTPARYIPPIEAFYFLKIGNMWRYFKNEHFSYWMICCYLFFEFFRPQGIYPQIDVLPWAQLFLMGALAGAILDKSVKWVSSPINKWLIVFAILIYISSLNAYFPELSKKYYIDFYSWFVIYFLIINIVNTKQRLYLFLIILILCAAKIAAGTSLTFASRGFGFTSWGLRGPPGYFTNSGELAILMLVLFPLAFYFYIYMKDKVSLIEKWILLLFWITPLLTIIGASSRGAQVALVIQLFMMFRKKLVKFKPLVMIGLLSFTLYSILPEEQLARFESAGDDRTSEQRLLYWKHGMEMILENPVLGVGYFNFAPYYQKYHSEDMLYANAQLPHNIFIQVGTDTGFLGLFAYSMLLIIPFWLSRKRVGMERTGFESHVLSGLLYGIVGFVLAGQFVTVTYYPFLWITLSFIVATLNCYRKQ